MKKKIGSLLLVFMMVLVPVVSLAQTTNVTINTGNSSDTSCANVEVVSIQTLFTLLTCILVKSLWPLLLASAVILFIIGVIKYIAGADDSTKRTEGRNFMVYGLIALFVMVSVWGLVYLLGNLVGVGQGTAPSGVFVPTPTDVVN